MYGGLDSIRLEGSIDGGYVREVCMTFEYPQYTWDFSGPAGVERVEDTVSVGYENSFKFLYSKVGNIYLSTVRFHLSKDPSGLYRYATRWESGVFVASTLDEIREHDSEAENLLVLLMYIVDPERQNKLLEEIPVRRKDTRINGARHVCLTFEAPTRRSLWIDPESNSISRLEYSVSRETRRKEIESLVHKLRELGESDLEQQDRVLRELETLEKRGSRKKRYVVRIEKQTFNPLSHLARPNSDGRRDLRTLNVDQEMQQDLLQEENARLKRLLAGDLTGNE